MRFGTQIDRKTLRGVLGNSEEAARRIGYITKHLTESIGEILEPPNTRTAVHYDHHLGTSGVLTSGSNDHEV
ncbi:hypothetical protein [Nocardia exalbida]|uniref:hypothetical protein n=1 Tax=Nocardia exalbida TaxID=290231 RepID=UPI00030D7E2E|nr:hypothetical protein [Nocardia exalbida]